MSAIPLILAVALILYLEIRGVEKLAGKLSYKGTLSSRLVAPGEEIVLEGRVRNMNPFPILYFTLMETFPENSRIIAEEKWCSRHVMNNMSGGLSTKYKLYFLPYSSFSTKTRFSIDKRGYYSSMKYYLENGDFMGMKSVVYSGNMEKGIVVMPEKSNSRDVWKSYSGFIGQISVDRFIMEDPVLTVGYRDYTGREPMKSISWQQSARTGKLMTKQYDHTAELNISIILNIEGGTEAELEECLRIVRSICEDMEKKKIPYGFYANGDIHKSKRPGLGYGHYSSIMSELGRTKLGPGMPFSVMIDEIIRKRDAEDGFIIVSPPFSERARAVYDRFCRTSEKKLCLLIGKDATKEDDACRK